MKSMSRIELHTKISAGIKSSTADPPSDSAAHVSTKDVKLEMLTIFFNYFMIDSLAE